MKKIFLATILAAAPASAWAHPGHIAESGGHSHWPALAILGGLGLALAGWGIAALARSLRRRRQA